MHSVALRGCFFAGAVSEVRVSRDEMNNQDYFDKRFFSSKIPIMLIFLGNFAFLYFLLGGVYALYVSDFVDFSNARRVIVFVIVMSSLAFFFWLFLGNLRITFELAVVAKRVSIGSVVEFETFIGRLKSTGLGSILSVSEMPPVSTLWSMSFLSKEKTNYRVLFSDNNRVYLSGDMHGVEELIDSLCEVR
ncbi:hypothetical protein CF392_14710 [Tamilnaduibacter salinus]|uniref:Uncharacterized protein n=1 Tax=Tamilnaduibacter salinus TaxID=1484056 RepID=A0A2A2HZH4_9GAMM|nr:hypothetical protein [Tamilnaduibacter salinus]PAV24722.1 hypothetical protein CF392_14710 [Tamilnaduibacter salinus]